MLFVGSSKGAVPAHLRFLPASVTQPAAVTSPTAIAKTFATANTIPAS